LEVQYASDLHLEFPKNREFISANPLIPVADTLILAGDTLVFNPSTYQPIDEQYDSYIDYLSNNFKQVFLLPGNHEFYGGFDISKTLHSFEMPLRENVTYINNMSVIINDYKIIFSALWTYIPNSFPTRYFGDFHSCMYNYERLTIKAYNEAYEISKEYIKSEIKNNSRKHKLLIVSHHLPSFKLIDPKYANNRLNNGFASMSDSLISLSNAKFWIYGHSHSNTNMRLIGQTKMITNPLGYVHRGENESFDLSKLIVLD